MKKNKIFLLAFCLSGLMVLFAVSGASAGPVKAPDKIKAVMIGDRLIDVALNLGVLPEGMSLRCSLWPKCKEIKLASQVLGCPRCLTKKHPKKLAAFMRERGITRLIIEKSEKFCLYMPVNPMQAVDLVKDMPGVKIEYVDFTRGIVPAVEQAGKLLGREKQAAELIGKYEKSLNKIEAGVPAKGLGKKVVILNGVYSAQTGKIFIRVEAPGGYTDQYILDPLGCSNAGGAMISDSAKVSKGHAMCRKLAGLAEAGPDVIAITGNGFAVQSALHEAMKKNPALAEVPAIKNGEVYNLPFYADSGVIEYPAVFKQWQDALSR